MREFFHGWRRKAGLVTLVVACVFMTGWVRSLNTLDEVTLPARKLAETKSIRFTADTLLSLKNSLIWKRTCQDVDANDNVLIQFMDEANISSTWRSSSRLPNFTRSVFNHDCDIMKWRWRSYGFGVCNASPDIARSAQMLFIPYWSIVLPLTALSVFLLVKKPKTSSPKKLTEPVPNEGATSWESFFGDGT